MKPVSLDLDHELKSLDQVTALQFKRTVRAMLRLVKAQQSSQPKAPFSERIARHPAIGTWPVNLNGDQHLARLRDEWER